MTDAPTRGAYAWGAMEWLAQGPSVGASLARMTVKAGETSPAHRHGNCNEVIHLLAGETEQRCGGDWTVMRAGDTIVIPQGTTHQTRNVGDGDVVMMICYSAGDRHYEAIED